MSITSIGDNRHKVTTATLAEKKSRREPITCLTAYDYATARLVDEAGIDLILVGDSLAQVVLGYDSTLPVTMEEMLHHTRAVRRAVKPRLPRRRHAVRLVSRRRRRTLSATPRAS